MPKGILHKKLDRLATHGKAEHEPEFAPRGRQWGEIFYKLFARNFEARFQAPTEKESEEDFRLRSAEGRAIDAYYEPPVQMQYEEDESTLRALAGAQA